MTSVLVIYPGHFLDRFAERGSADDPLADTRGLFGELVGWFEEQPEYRDGRAPVAFSDPLIGPLAGGSFAHDLRLLPSGASCESLASVAQDGWIVLTGPSAGPSAPLVACFAEVPPIAEFDGSGGIEARIYRFPRDR